MVSPPYSRFAEVYDAVYTRMVNYPGCAERVHELIQEARPGAGTLLDVACGTGQYTQYLARRYAVRGIDLSAEMLAVARRRLPEVEFDEWDMADFDLGVRFDAVVCLFSSIAYVVDPDRLTSALAAFARHTNPGGVVIVEPFYGPEDWEEGRTDLTTVERDGLVVARAGTSVRDGDVVVLRWSFAVARRDGSVDAFVEDHPVGLFRRADYEAAFAAAGLEMSYDPDGLIGRGLYLARKPG